MSKINTEKLNKMGLLIKAVFMVILVAFLMFVISGASAKDINLTTVDKELKLSTDVTTTMTKMGARDLKQFIGISANDYSQVIYYRNITALAVDELLIVKAEESSQLSSVEGAVNERISSQIKTYESYGPEQVKLLKNAIQLKKGNYYFYCTADKADEYEEVLLNAVQ